MPARIDVAPVPAPIPPPAVLPPLNLQPPAAAPHSMSEDPAEAAKNERLQAKAAALRAAPSAVPISDVTVILGMKTKQGRQEVIHDIGPDFRILDCTHNVKEKVRAVTEEGMFLGMEPTGEYEMIIKIKYIKV